MPKLGLTMTEGTVARWDVAPGGRFQAGDIILVVETDKIAYDVEAPGPGILQEVLVAAGSAVPVGTPIGRWDVGDIKVSLDAPNIEAHAEFTGRRSCYNRNADRIAGDAAARRGRADPGHAFCPTLSPARRRRSSQPERHRPQRPDQGRGC